MEEIKQLVYNYAKQYTHRMKKILKHYGHLKKIL